VGRIPPARARGAEQGALTADDVKEIILQQTAYCGTPAGNHAFREAGEIVKEVMQGR
jgi:alkylhydroperoxidase/carboxymuconolactone decarboxylase family protein YurZ